MNEMLLAVSALFVFGFLLAHAPSLVVAGGKRKRPERRAILLVAFGTAVPEAQKAFEQIHAQASGAFPHCEIRWAYTSRVIRTRLAREGRTVSSPEMALAGLMEEGFTRVAVLSLHVIPGIEFHDLIRNAGLFGQMAGGFERILVARPLLSSRRDMVRVASALIQRIPAERKPEEAVILLGHGTEKHPSDAIYAAMAHTFAEMAPLVFVGTVQGYPAMEDVLPKLQEKKVRKAFLMPFMAVAGDHARKDMAGDQADSWKSQLHEEGITVETVLTGIAEYPEIVEIWLDHLREVVAGL